MTKTCENSLPRSCDYLVILKNGAKKCLRPEGMLCRHKEDGWNRRVLEQMPHDLFREMALIYLPLLQQDKMHISDALICILNEKNKYYDMYEKVEYELHKLKSALAPFAHLMRNFSYGGNS